MRFLPILALALLPAACKLPKTVPTPPAPIAAPTIKEASLPAPDGTTVYIYEVETGADRYEFNVQVTHSDEDGMSFNFAMSNETRHHGNVWIVPEVLDTAHGQLNYFNSENYELTDACTVWFSKAMIHELLTQGQSSVYFKKPDAGYPGYGSLASDGAAALRRVDTLAGMAAKYHCEYNGATVSLDAVFAEGLWKGRKVRYAVLKDAEYPLILFMDIGFRIRLKQVMHLHSMPDPLALQTGSILKYVYMHIDSVGPESYDYVDDTLIIRLNRFDSNGAAGAWALYRNSPDQATQKGSCLGLFGQTGEFVFWPNPQRYCTGKPAAFNGHCQGWWFNHQTLEPLRQTGNRTGFYFNDFTRFETWEIKPDESGMFPRRTEIRVNGAEIPCFGHRIGLAGDMSGNFMDFLPGTANPILLRWSVRHQVLWLHSVQNP
jgi:hypothetical protein